METRGEPLEASGEPVDRLVTCLCVCCAVVFILQLFYFDSCLMLDYVHVINFRVIIINIITDYTHMQ